MPGYHPIFLECAANAQQPPMQWVWQPSQLGARLIIQLWRDAAARRSWAKGVDFSPFGYTYHRFAQLLTRDSGATRHETRFSETPTPSVRTVTVRHRSRPRTGSGAALASSSTSAGYPCCSDSQEEVVIGLNTTSPRPRLNRPPKTRPRAASEDASTREPRPVAARA